MLPLYLQNQRVMLQGSTAVKTQKVSRKREKIQTKSMKISTSSSDLSKQYRYEFLQSKHTAGEGKENKAQIIQALQAEQTYWCHGTSPSEIPILSDLSWGCCGEIM